MRSCGKKIKTKTSGLAAILAILLEAGLLKRVRRSGWWVVGIDNPESVAEHSFRTALIGYFLASQEKADPYRVLVMSLFGDLHEARINDLHKMGQRYIDFSSAENRAFSEQISHLPAALERELAASRQELVLQRSSAAVIARDADILECLLQAKEYTQQGYPGAKEFFKKAPQQLKSKAAKKLWRAIRSCRINEWWQALSEFKR